MRSARAPRVSARSTRDELRRCSVGARSRPQLRRPRHRCDPGRGRGVRQGRPPAGIHDRRPARHERAARRATACAPGSPAPSSRCPTVSSSTWRRPRCARRAPGFDLAIALAILGAAGAVCPRQSLRGVGAFGELGLDGTVRPCRGRTGGGRGCAPHRAGGPAVRARVVRRGGAGRRRRADPVPRAGACGRLPAHRRGAADAAAATAARRGGGARPGRRARAAARAPRAGDRGRRRAQPADGRAAGCRQVDAGAAAAGHPAAADPARVARGDAAAVRGRHPRARRWARDAAAVPGAAPLGLVGGAGRRRAESASGRAQPREPRRAVPGRAARVPARRIGGPARADGGRRAGDRAGDRLGRLPVPHRRHRRDEPLPVRWCRRLHVHGRATAGVPAPGVRAAARPHGHRRAPAASHRRGAARRPSRGHGRRGGPRPRGDRPAGGAGRTGERPARRGRGAP